MQIKNAIPKKDSLVKKYKYFCPHCRTLFEDIEGDHRIIDKSKCKNYKHQCKECKKCFNQDTYLKQASSRKNYKLPHNKNKKEVNTHIKKIIQNFIEKDYSISEIREITHFGISKIRPIVKSFNSIEKVLTKKQFCTKYLKINPDYYDAIIEEYPSVDPGLTTDFFTDSIRKALNFGCSIRQIAKLFKVSPKTIDKIKQKKYVTERKIYKHNHQSDEAERDAFLKQSEKPIPGMKKLKKPHKIEINIEKDEIKLILSLPKQVY